MSEELPKTLDDIPWNEGNKCDGHKITLESSLPSPTWRKLGKVVGGKTTLYEDDGKGGVPSRKSKSHASKRKPSNKRSKR